MTTYFSHGAKFIPNLLNVESGDIGDTETVTTYLTTGNSEAFTLIVPETMTAATVSVYAYYGANESDVDVWTDITSTIASGATMSAKEYVYSTNKYMRLKLIYTASNATNHGKVHAIVYGK